MTEPLRYDRRGILRTGAVALGGAGLGWTGSAAALAATDHGSGRSPSGAVGTEAVTGAETVAFHGTRQAGVATAPQAHLSLVGLDLRPGVTRSDLDRMMRLLSDDAARLGEGRAALADTEPELATVPARLTVTFGFGPRVVSDLVPGRHGVTLDPLPPFSTDRLQEAWGQTDIVLQLCGDDQVTVAHARRMLVKDARGFAEVRWVQDGFRRSRGSETAGTTMRNVMGQVDGTTNPAPEDPDFDALVWDDGTRGPAFAGGTFLVVRRIRARMDAWDRVGREGKELAVGRRLADGAPLTGSSEAEDPDFEATDDLGFPIIDTAAHIRRARTEDPGQRFLRRSYNYAVPDPSRPGGEDTGLVFLAYARDVAKQFVPVQRRLAELDRLNQWATTTGSAVYALPPGATGPGTTATTTPDYVGRTLLAPTPTRRQS